MTKWLARAVSVRNGGKTLPCTCVGAPKALQGQSVVSITAPAGQEHQNQGCTSTDVTPLRVHSDSSELIRRGFCREENKPRVTCGWG